MVPRDICVLTKKGKIMYDKIAEASLLYDFYGQLLTDKQKQVMELYHEENLSLAEIAVEFGISRQGVHDTLKKAEKALLEYENKLGLVRKFAKTQAVINQIDSVVDEIEKQQIKGKDLLEKLSDIKTIINRLD